MADSAAYNRLRIKNIKEEIKGFKTFSFEDGHAINYKAGQYLTFVAQHTGRDVRRSYSITSSPVLSEPLSVGIKRVENGLFSRQLIDTAVVGDELICAGSGGFFVLPDDVEHYNQLFFFAAGSGITPVYSLIKTTLYAHPHLSVVLVYSNSSVDKTVFYEELKHLQQSYAGRFYIRFLFSNAVLLAEARLHRDLIFQLLDQLLIKEKNKTLFYICGPENYMRLCTYTIEEAGIDSSNIRKENFVINALPKHILLPPDKETHMVSIKMSNSEYNIEVHYPDSILKAARDRGIILPYSCEAGRCGNCVARCISGTVWHSYNEVLTEKDLQKGLVLTCVGHPVGGNVTLEV